MDTVILNNKCYIKGFASAAGSLEGQGLYGKYFDAVFDDPLLNKDTWEKAESELQHFAIDKATKKAHMENKIELIIAGDLLNQCTASTFSSLDSNSAYMGVYGACSTMALSMAIGSFLVSGGFKNNLIAATSSHFCSSERQYRFPLEYGGQRTPSQQHTVTGAGAVVLTNEKSDIYINAVTIGKIVDLGIKDANNMGAAMAPAAAETILTYFRDTNTSPEDYDALFTGDLGEIGSNLLIDILKENNIDVTAIHDDCGLMIYDRESQDVHAGGSGCGCSASILCGYILNMMARNELKNVLFCATGALLSPTSVNQKQSIPGVAHLVNIKTV